jgi:hypothetical protein
MGIDFMLMGNCVLESVPMIPIKISRKYLYIQLPTARKHSFSGDSIGSLALIF